MEKISWVVRQPMKKFYKNQNVQKNGNILNRMQHHKLGWIG